MDAHTLISETIKSSISNFFHEKDVKVYHVLDLIFPTERRIRSLIGGLETSLGTKLWEPLAIAFALNNGFNLLEHKNFNKNVPVIPQIIRNEISNFSEEKRRNQSLRNEDFYKKICHLISSQNIIPNEYQKIPKGEGIDIWLEKDGTEYIIDIKTTQINAGSGPKFTQTQLNWYAYRALERTQNHVVCWLAFPFNTHKGKDFWYKEKGKVSPLIPSHEAVVGNEFWDFIYGKNNTTEMIFECFEMLGKSDFGKQFESQFQFR